MQTDKGPTSEPGLNDSQHPPTNDTFGTPGPEKGIHSCTLDPDHRATNSDNCANWTVLPVRQAVKVGFQVSRVKLVYTSPRVKCVTVNVTLAAGGSRRWARILGGAQMMTEALGLGPADASFTAGQGTCVCDLAPEEPDWISAPLHARRVETS